MYIRIAIPALLVLLFVGAPTARADKTTKQALEVLAELRFEEAQTIATKGLEEGTRGPEELSKLYMILGQVSASLGEEAKAEASFRAALSLDSEASLPDGVSPKLSEPFQAAQTSLEEEQPIELLAEVGEDGQLSVQVASDPAELAGGIEATYKQGGKTKTQRATGKGTVRLELPSGVTELHVALVDEHGNRLIAAIPVQLGETKAVEVKKKKTDTTAPGQPIYSRWQLYAGLAVGSLATGAYFGNVSRSKTDEIAELEDGTEFSVAQGLEDQAKKNALYANLGFAVGAGFGALAIWMYVREGADSESQPATAFVPILSSDRVGVAAHVSF